MRSSRRCRKRLPSRPAAQTQSMLARNRALECEAARLAEPRTRAEGGSARPSPEARGQEGQQAQQGQHGQQRDTHVSTWFAGGTPRLDRQRRCNSPAECRDLRHGALNYLLLSGPLLLVGWRRPPSPSLVSLTPCFTNHSMAGWPMLGSMVGAVRLRTRPH